MPWGAAIAAVGGLAAANESKKGAKAAAGASQDAASSSNALQGYIYDTNRSDQQPFYQAGVNALSQINRLNVGDMSGFTDSPDYAYARDQAQQGVERGAAARGGLFNGGESVDLANALNGVASQNYNNYYNKLASLAGVGQTTATNLAGQGQSYANSVGQNNLTAANATASAYQQNANTNAQLYTGLAGLANKTGQQQGWWG
jgi:hypothetical protein